MVAREYLCRLRAQAMQSVGSAWLGTGKNWSCGPIPYKSHTKRFCFSATEAQALPSLFASELGPLEGNLLAKELLACWGVSGFLV